MPVRMVLTKAIATGEQFQADVVQWNPVTGEMMHSTEELQELFDEVAKGADLRLMEMNARHIEAYGLEQWCKPETWQKIIAVMDILAGRVSAQVVQQRWQAEIEETGQLEAGRVAKGNGYI